MNNQAVAVLQEGCAAAAVVAAEVLYGASPAWRDPNCLLAPDAAAAAADAGSGAGAAEAAQPSGERPEGQGRLQHQHALMQDVQRSISKRSTLVCRIRSEAMDVPNFNTTCTVCRFGGAGALCRTAAGGAVG